MSKYRAVFAAFVVVSAISISVPAAGAGQGRGHGPAKKAEKAEKHENTAEKKADKRHDKSHDKRHDKGHDKSHDTGRVIVVDRDGHHRVIREYAVAGSLPPGLAKRDSLPPGLRNQLRERGTLPPGLQKRLVPVPEALVTRLPAVPSYYTRYFAGDDFIVVDTRTNQIIAIVRDVWR